MKRIYTWAFVGICFLATLFSCQEREVEHKIPFYREDFPIVDSLVGTDLEINELEYARNFLVLKDSIIIIRNSNKRSQKEKALFVYSLSQKKVLFSTLDPGVDPKAFDKTFIKYIDNEHFAVLNTFNSISVWNLKALLRKKMFYLPMKYKNRLFAYPYPTADTLWISVNRRYNPYHLDFKPFHIWNNIKNPSYNVCGTDSTCQSKSMLGNEVIASSTKTDTFAVANFWIDEIRLFHQGNKFKTLIGPDHYPLPNIEEQGGFFRYNKDKSYLSYTFGFGTKNAFYLLYKGKHSQNIKTLSRNRQELFVFHWNGTPKARYVLDRNYLYIQVSEDEKTLFGTAIDYETERYRLYKIEL